MIIRVRVHVRTGRVTLTPARCAVTSARPTWQCTSRRRDWKRKLGYLLDPGSHKMWTRTPAPSRHVPAAASDGQTVRKRRGLSGQAPPTRCRGYLSQGAQAIELGVLQARQTLHKLGRENLPCMQKALALKGFAPGGLLLKRCRQRGAVDTKVDAHGDLRIGSSRRAPRSCRPLWYRPNRARCTAPCCSAAQRCSGSGSA